MGSESKRLKILNQLRATFLNAKQGIDRNKLIIEICMQEGVTKKKADEYIQVLIDGEFIMEDEFGLWLKNGEPNKIDEEMELKADLARKNEDGETRIEE